MDLFDVVAAVLVLSALFSYANHRWLRLPSTIGLMIVALAFSLAIASAGHYWAGVEERAKAMIGRISFDRTVMNGMLGFLLFAGSLHLSLSDVWKHRGAILVLATVGVALSTIVVGLVSWWLLTAFGFGVRPIYCFLFGALISPTDPLAVLSIMKQLQAPKGWEIIISGESLLNDGVGVAIFVGLLSIARGEESFAAAHFAGLFAREAIGGAVFGLAIGGLAFLLLRSVDQYQVEVLISIALVAGGYAVADALGVSGPIAMVMAGLLIGNKGRELAMSQLTRERLDVFWELVDEVLNSLLFVMVGLELVVIHITGKQLIAGTLLVPVVLVARLVSVGIPLAVVRLWRRTAKGTLIVLTWSGLRGGISLAMALSLHGHLRATDSPEAGLLLPLTYIVVVYSIIVQGLTVGRVIKRSVARHGADGPIATEPTQTSTHPRRCA